MDVIGKLLAFEEHGNLTGISCLTYKPLASVAPRTGATISVVRWSDPDDVRLGDGEWEKRPRPATAAPLLADDCD
jgi:hypothetical protein